MLKLTSRGIKVAYVWPSYALVNVTVLPFFSEGYIGKMVEFGKLTPLPSPRGLPSPAKPRLALPCPANPCLGLLGPTRPRLVLLNPTEPRLAPLCLI